MQIKPGWNVPSQPMLGECDLLAIIQALIYQQGDVVRDIVA